MKELTFGMLCQRFLTVASMVEEELVEGEAMEGTGAKPELSTPKEGSKCSPP